MTGLKKIAVLASALLLGGCGGPKIIPDGELAQIFHDIYLVNSYVNQNNLVVDSLNIYEPVFASYGYTSEDLQYTIGNFAKRKSARISDDVVEVASGMLRDESRRYRHSLAVRDTVARVARDKFAEQLLFDSLIRVRRIADTGRLRIVIPDIRPGRYDVSFGYLLDSLDRNNSLRANIYFLDDGGRLSGSTQRRLERGGRQEIQATLNATDLHRSLVLALNGYPGDLTTPNLTIDSLSVMYYLPDEEAVRKLSRSWYGGSTLDSLYSGFKTIPERP